MGTLVRTLRFRDLTLLIVGGVIGSGIFLVPGAILRRVDGSAGLGLLAWLVGGLLSLLGALTYGELAAMNPETGGLYIYVRDGFGRLPAFLYGWTLFLVVSTGSVATLAVAFSAYLAQIEPLTPLAAKAGAVAMIAAVTAINIRGARHSSNFQNWTTFVKVGAIVLMGVALLVLGHGYALTAAGFWPAKWSGSLLSRFGVAMLAVLWAYEGWQFPAYTAGETVDPQRNFPRAFLIGTLCLIAIYLFANAGYLAALGPARAAATDTIAASAVAAVSRAGLARLVALIILVATFSAANSVQLTAPRVFYAMAADGLFFQKLATIHPRFRTPAFAVLASGIWSAVLASSGSFEQLFTYVIFTGWIFYGLAAASIFLYRRRQPHRPRPYLVPGYPWTPALFVLAAAAIVVNAIAVGPSGAAEGLAIVLTGVPAYFFWHSRAKGLAL
ncbi:MAG TPA: amino acid permease [Candidatus Acidoferrales bacterium]|nr:amino acid permease [Candidatus Acidoferrales bacterium]